MNHPPIVNFINALFAMNATGSVPLMILKIVILFGLSIYLVFGLVVLRQISLMTRTIQTSLTGPLKTIGLIHMVVAIIVWLTAFVLL
jgi:hypothetical protein